jgi:exodeoxyribonuclease VII large subunit
MNTPLSPRFHNMPVQTVSEVAGRVKKMLESDFGGVRIRGEISGLKIHSSGHAYFSLKDRDSVIDVVCWAGQYARLKSFIQEGAEIIASGGLSLYAKSSRYQLIIETAEMAGVGAMLALIEERRKRLEKEGLFDQIHKKPLPYLPRLIGIATSPTGAVIRDIIHRIRERWPVPLVLWPCQVQGEGAASSIIHALNGLAALTPAPDMVILARGGGSVEDLWCFHDEDLVRLVANYPIPIITAVGHETDTTLVDYASDKRAPTPTAAAEMAVPVREQVRLRLEEQGRLLVRLLMGKIALYPYRLAHLTLRLASIPQRLETYQQQLVKINLKQSLKHGLMRAQHTLYNIGKRLSPPSLSPKQERLKFLETQQQTAWQHSLDRRVMAVQSLARVLNSLSYHRTLERGFTVTLQHHKIITHKEQIQAQSTLTIRFADGDLHVIPRNKQVRMSQAKQNEQPDLFNIKDTND